MRELHHPNVIKLIHGFFEQTVDDESGKLTMVLNILTEFIPGTISRVSYCFTRLGQRLHPLLTKLYAY